ncbi:16850_t:CDS:2 [Cetraspora pellucida]|uniref:16850_t:CDS:1 n=1 Tax=Cetraspora pellucida TaxID=1433469 RepID=A0A9N9HUC1_9GLOM|nr:16850_t:CDS:2 [Cetraspora pellucida]
MLPSSKGKRKARNQNRNSEGQYCNFKKVLYILVILTDQENLEDKFGELYNSDEEDIYYDDYERKDVLEYRKTFLEKIFEYEKYMSKYEVNGCLCLQQFDIEKYSNIPKKTRCYLIPDANQEAVFAFNNSSNYDIFSKDALIASRMNLDPDKKQLIIHDTYFGENNQLQLIIFQKQI